mmetsp:Transcript_9160/g.13242  ORF Transcript_9160/g.13242 Transcript_9160/m.13242 type:complete len:124 (+) Transcript_9160:515-886(+)
MILVGDGFLNLLVLELLVGRWKALRSAAEVRFDLGLALVLDLAETGPAVEAGASGFVNADALELGVEADADVPVGMNMDVDKAVVFFVTLTLGRGEKLLVNRDRAFIVTYIGVGQGRSVSGSV